MLIYIDDSNNSRKPGTKIYTCTHVIYPLTSIKRLEARTTQDYEKNINDTSYQIHTTDGATHEWRGEPYIIESHEGSDRYQGWTCFWIAGDSETVEWTAAPIASFRLRVGLFTGRIQFDAAVLLDSTFELSERPEKFLIIDTLLKRFMSSNDNSYWSSDLLYGMKYHARNAFPKAKFALPEWLSDQALKEGEWSQSTNAKGFKTA